MSQASSQSPWQKAWQSLVRNPLTVAAMLLLVVFSITRLGLVAMVWSSARFVKHG
jgi:cell division protein FtsX